MARTAKLYLGTRKGLFVLERTERGWEIEHVAFEGDNVPMLLPDARDGAVYAVLGHGHFGSKLHRSDDGGQSFRELAAPKYPAKPAGESDVDAVRGTDVSWSLELIWELSSGGVPGRLWAGTIPGGLFRSDDAGESWELMRGLWDRPERRQWFGGGMDRPGIHSVLVDPRDPEHLLIGISCGGIWRSRDAGRTFTLEGEGMRAEFLPPEQAFDRNTQDPHRLAHCRVAPEVVWVQHHNGVFRSTDGGSHFSELSSAMPSSFGFAVAAHPQDPLTAWFVPATKDERRVPKDGRVVVLKTSDGGRSFQEKTRGLPQRFAYDLVYRHCLDVTSTGEVLAFGSTTGNLWISEDAGESFELISTHLPPIYALRFLEPAGQ